MSEQIFYVVGCGSMARRRLRHVTQLRPGAKLVVWDIRPDRMAEVAEMFQVERMTGPDDAAAYKPAGMFISVPPSEHEFYIEWAIAHGVPFMVEQPISHETVRLDSICERVKEKGLIAHVSNNHRHSARINTIKRLLDSGELGRPLTAMVAAGEYLPDWHSYEPYTDYYPSKKSMGGGLDAVCEIDWLRALFGEIDDIICMAGRYSDLDVDTLDAQQFCMRFKDGPQVSLHIDMLNRFYHAELRIICSEGTIEHRMPEPELKVFRVQGGKRWTTVPLEEDYSNMPSMKGKESFNFVEPMYQGDSKYFLDRIDAGDAGLWSLQSGIHNIKVVKDQVDKAEKEAIAHGRG